MKWENPSVVAHGDKTFARQKTRQHLILPTYEPTSSLPTRKNKPKKFQAELTAFLLSCESSWMAAAIYSVVKC